MNENVEFFSENCGWRRGQIVARENDDIYLLRSNNVLYRRQGSQIRQDLSRQPLDALRDARRLELAEIRDFLKTNAAAIPFPPAPGHENGVVNEVPAPTIVSSNNSSVRGTGAASESSTNITCPACRGQHRRHTRTEGCRKFQPQNVLLTTTKTEQDAENKMESRKPRKPEEFEELLKGRTQVEVSCEDIIRLDLVPEFEKAIAKELHSNFDVENVWEYIPNFKNKNESKTNF